MGQVGPVCAALGKRIKSALPDRTKDGPAFSITISDGKWRKSKTAFFDFRAEKSQGRLFSVFP
jgi:hypothetical protein